MPGEAAAADLRRRPRSSTARPSRSTPRSSATGARTALIVTEGTRDVYAIGRGNRPEAYNLFFRRPAAARAAARDARGRRALLAAGEVVTRCSTRTRIAAACAAAARGTASNRSPSASCTPTPTPSTSGASARSSRRELPGTLRARSRTRSCASTASTNARRRRCSTPTSARIVSRYLDDLERPLRDARLRAASCWIMQSSGGVMAPETATRGPVAMMESGPVGGIIAAAEVGRALGYPNVIAFDMGGTTAKASLIRDSDADDRATATTSAATPSGHPVMLPGGRHHRSRHRRRQHRVDRRGRRAQGRARAARAPTRVRSATARRHASRPSPMRTSCSAASGPERFLGGEMPLDVEAAREAIAERSPSRSASTRRAAALGIVEIAIAEMSLAVRGVSVANAATTRAISRARLRRRGPAARGRRSRANCTSRRSSCRACPGHFSALGMLLADLRHDYVRTVLQAAGPRRTSPSCGRIFDEMVGEAAR